MRKSVANANGFNMEKTRQSSFLILKPKSYKYNRKTLNDDKDITELKRSTLAYVNFTKIFLKRISLNQIRKGNRF